MIFTQYWFIEFAALVVPAYLLLRRPMLRYLFLLAACAVFHYHFAGPAGVLPIIVLGITVYFLARTGDPRACAAGIGLCAAALAFYKYPEFFCTEVVGLFNKRWSAGMLDFYHAHNPGVPLGISFFTFEFVHYLYEVRHKRPAISNPLDFAIFTIFFPSLVAGPIKRYEDFLASLKRGIREVNSDDIAAGLLRIATGYFKKTCIADNITTCIKEYDPRFFELPVLNRWVFFFGLALRILMDFSGYSDIAIGFARLFGIRLPENFNWPYLAKNLQDFWQRWHISLSTWIRDYIYIPLGGGRVAVPRRILNAMIAFALCGLWHGAAWHYVLWGLYHGAGLAININYRKAGAPGRWLGWLFSRVPGLGRAVTLMFVCAGWLLFFYPADQAGRMALALAPTAMRDVAGLGAPEPDFNVPVIAFNPVAPQQTMDEYRIGNVFQDGWVSGKATFLVPERAPWHEAVIEVMMPDGFGVPDSKITISVNGKKIVSQPLGYGLFKFTVPLRAPALDRWLAKTGLHLYNRITIEGAKSFPLPKPDWRDAYFRIQSVTFD